jgi:hypothetical protein
MPFQPIILGRSAITIDGDAFEGQVGGAVFTPSASQVSWTAINSDTHSFTTPATWVLDLTYAQDWNFAAALSRYLHENEGTVVEVVFEPVDGQPSVTANVSITPGAIGAGDVTSVASSTVSLGSTKPVLAAAPA